MFLDRAPRTSLCKTQYLWASLVICRMGLVILIVSPFQNRCKNQIKRLRKLLNASYLFVSTYLQSALTSIPGELF